MRNANKLVNINRRVYDALMATKPDYDSGCAYLSRTVEQALIDRKKKSEHYYLKKEFEEETAIEKAAVSAVDNAAVGLAAVTSNAHALPIEEKEETMKAVFLKQAQSFIAKCSTDRRINNCL